MADQHAFVPKIATLLKPNGFLMLATQNRPALERSAIPAPMPGQLRRWVDRSELEKLLERDFQLEKIFTITPSSTGGVRRIINSNQLKQLAKAIGLEGMMAQVKKGARKCGAWLDIDGVSAKTSSRLTEEHNQTSRPSQAPRSATRQQPALRRQHRPT